MMRAIAGVIVGYVVIVLVLFALMTGAWLGLGPEGAFKSKSYETATLWGVVTLIAGLAAAVVGGMVCGVISRSLKAGKVFAVILLVLGVLVAVMEMGKPAPPPREGAVDMKTAMTQAKQPAWVAWSNPLVGALGVLIGAGARRKKA